MTRALVRLRWFALASALLAALGWSVLARTTDNPPRHWALIETPTKAERDAVAALGIAIEWVGEYKVGAYLTGEEVNRLRQAGFTVQEAPLPLDFPPTDAAYHNFTEMEAEIIQAQMDHPDIVQVSVIGRTWEDHPIYAIKISDNVTEDEAEPEVLYMALHHGREHLTVEMALYILRLFTDNYGLSGTITNLVDQRELWVLPNVNPDGGEFDIKFDYYHWWRKNRRDNGQGIFGVDLNRNYGYHWGCCGGSSSSPWDETYRGPAPFSEPETRAVRDFVLAHPDIIASISFHTYSELILWPWGFTRDPVPDPDRRVFEAIGQAMAATNDYTPSQAWELYVTDGDSDDWLYGVQGIFAFTFEMYPRYDPPGFYPPASVISAQTVRNREAVEYLAAVSDNPYKVIGQGGDVTPPTVTLTYPAPGQWVAGVETLDASAFDDVGVTLVEFLVDGETVGLDRTEPFAITYDFSDRLGERVISVRAYDHGANVGVSSPVTVTAVGSTPTSSPSPSPSDSPTPTASPSATLTATPSATPTASASEVPTPTGTATLTPPPTRHLFVPMLQKRGT